MKLKLLIAAFLMIHFSTKAQLRYFGGITATNHQSILYNENDWNADERLDYERVGTMSYGIEAGIQGKSGAGITVGIEKSEWTQNYFGKYENAGSYSMKATTKLNYMKLPIGLQLSSDPTSKAALLINGGVFFAQLTGSSDNVLMQYSGDSAQNSYSLLLENKNYTRVNTIGTQEERLSHRPYSQNLLGAHLSIGAAFRIVRKFQLAVQFKTEYTFNDLENKKTLSTDNAIALPFYENTYAKYTYETNASTRAKTNLLSMGIQVRLRYFFNWEKRKKIVKKQSSK